MALLRGLSSAKVPGGTLKSLYPVSISKERGQGILRQIGILEKKPPAINVGKGEVQAIRTIVGMGEGFQMPVNFKVEFAMPKGIDQKKLGVAAHTESVNTHRGSHTKHVNATYEGANTSKVKNQRNMTNG